MRILARVLIGLAGLLALVLVVGLLLPGRWTARASSVIPAPPEAVFPYLDTPDRWDLWTSWSEVESVLHGPRSGPGAERRWSDEAYGEGALRIEESDPPRAVSYRVLVEGGSLEIHGTLRLESVAGGTRVTWVEEGDFGWNPLMGFVARSMSEDQGEEMRRSLERLERVVEGRP